MIKNLTKHGNSLALVLDKPILELLKMDEKTPLDISTDGRLLIVAPANKNRKEKRFHEAVQWANRRYAKALKKLAN